MKGVKYFQVKKAQVQVRSQAIGVKVELQVFFDFAKPNHTSAIYSIKAYQNY